MISIKKISDPYAQDVFAPYGVEYILAHSDEAGKVCKECLFLKKSEIKELYEVTGTLLAEISEDKFAAEIGTAVAQ